MNKESAIVGVAWKHAGPPLTMEAYKALLARPDAILRIVMADGKVLGELPLIVIPNCDMWNDEFYVFPESIIAGAVDRWEAPKECLLRLSILGDGFYWIKPSGGT